MDLSSEVPQSPEFPLCEPPADVSLQTLRLDIEALTAQMSAAFMELAGNLQSIATHAKGVSKLSDEASKVAVEGESDHAFATLNGILDGAEKTEGLANMSREKLRELLRQVWRTKSPLAQLLKLRPLLATLGTLARIEATRIDNNEVNLSGLADQIYGLGTEAEENSLRIETQVSELTKVLMAGAKTLEGLKSNEAQQATALTTQTRAVLDPLRARATSSRASAVSIAQQYSAIRKASDGIVVSLQVEDIARQRLEHVQQALAQAEADSPDSVPASLLALQRAQLAGTRDLVVNAIHAISEGLKSLAPGVDSLIQETESLASRLKEDEHAFQNATGDNLGGLAAIFAQYTESAGTVLSIIDVIFPSVANMTKAAEALEDIELSMQLVAVNAAIKTAHLGGEGAPMGVIANALQKAASDSEANSQAVLSVTTEMKQLLQTLKSCQFDSTGTALTSCSAEQIGQDLEALSASFRKSNQELAGRFSNVLSVAGAMGSEVLTACVAAEQNSVVGVKFDSALSALDRLAELLHLSIDQTGIESMAMDDIAGTYSMQSERDIHDSLFRPDDLASATGTPSPASEADDDGVELF